MIKFKSQYDPKDIGPIEYAYHLMATSAGLNVPKATLFPSKKGGGFFGVERFDRLHHERIHTHTLSGLLHADHRIPSLDYESILKATLLLTKDEKECETQFRNAVFNVLSHNRDDHAKNFSFIMPEKNMWKVSPAYDLTFSHGVRGEHASLIMGEGLSPNKTHLLKLAETALISIKKALDIIDEVQSAVQKWPNYAEEAGVSKKQMKHIKAHLEKISKNF